MKRFVMLLAALFMFACGEADTFDTDNIMQIDPNAPSQLNGPFEAIEHEQPKPEIVPQDKQKGPFTKIERNTIEWEVSTNCGNQPGNPKLMFYDKQSGETFGPYTLNTAKKNIEVWCKKGNEICWGAWMGKGNYHDCSKADETGYCVLVKWNPLYYTWGCGEDCSKYSVPTWYCPYCYDNNSKDIYLSCGG